MGIVEEPSFAGIIDRMMEITSTVTPWHRRLWHSGTMQLARELLDESIKPGAKVAAVDRQRNYLMKSLESDPGIKDRGQCVRGTIKLIKAGTSDLSHTWINVNEHVLRMQASYLKNWAEIFDSRATVSVEGAARRITAHLLDLGMHKNSLYSLLRATKNSQDSVSLGDFFRIVDSQAKRAERTYIFCVPVETKPKFPIGSGSTQGWMSASETAQWKSSHAPDASNVRQQGSFLLEVKARDVNSAADKARSVISNLVTKFQLGTSKRIVVCSKMWSLEKNADFPTQATNRIVKILSFERLERVQELVMDDYIANTLSLVQPLQTGAPHIAVISGWSAIESLLVEQSDEDSSIAAERFSLIVAASMVRAELTSLSRRYMETYKDSFARRMQNCSENIDRARLFQIRAMSDERIDLHSQVENMALTRIQPVLKNPGAEVRKIADILTPEFARLYRKRNMVIHGGQIQGNNLHAISETLAPLIGAGIDRIVHVGLKYQVGAVHLSAVAQSRLNYLTPASSSDHGNLLDLLEF
ncbi:MAG: integrase [Mycobacteriaceae bacterium]